LTLDAILHKDCVKENLYIQVAVDTEFSDTDLVILRKQNLTTS